VGCVERQPFTFGWNEASGLRDLSILEVIPAEVAAVACVVQSEPCSYRSEANHSRSLQSSIGFMGIIPRQVRITGEQYIQKAGYMFKISDTGDCFGREVNLIFARDRAAS